MAWILVSNQSSEDKVSGVRMTILFSICSDDNLFGSISCSLLTFINLFLVVQRFDQMKKPCLEIFSQSDIQKMDVQSWWYALHFGRVLMKAFSIHRSVITLIISIFLLVFKNFDHLEKYFLGVFSQSDLQKMDNHIWC